MNIVRLAVADNTFLDWNFAVPNTTDFDLLIMQHGCTYYAQRMVKPLDSSFNVLEHRDPKNFMALRSRQKEE
uniref:Uncharacterized protein n=1 Tax=Romanomermis culicivorax TaxID=13658 RepID=A0A915K9N7_ROMCU